MTADSVSFDDVEDKVNVLSADNFAQLSNSFIPNSDIELNMIGLTNSN